MGRTRALPGATGGSYFDARSSETARSGGALDPVFGVPLVPALRSTIPKGVLMARVMPGRFTAQRDEPFVVFLIGMRVHSPLAVRKWVPTRPWPWGRCSANSTITPRRAFSGPSSSSTGPGRRQSNTGAPSTTWSDSPATRTTRTSRRGAASTRPWGRERRHLARDLRGRSGSPRNDLRQHAHVRPDQCDETRTGQRPTGDHPPANEAGRERAFRPLRSHPRSRRAP